MSNGGKPTYIGLKAWDMGFDAHLTVMYLGPLDGERENYVNYVLSQIGRQEFLVGRNRIDLFANSTPVVVVDDVTDNLKKLRKRLERTYGLISPSTFPFNPHISLSLDHYETVHIPLTIKLDQLGFY